MNGHDIQIQHTGVQVPGSTALFFLGTTAKTQLNLK
jgi:hypothetical protein